MKKYILCLFLAGCAGDKPDIQLTDTACTWVKPIYVNKNDKLTEKTSVQILAHDDKWQKICGGNK